MSADRLCVVCAEPLAGRRSHARFCSGACRAEAGMLGAILDDPAPPDANPTLAARLAARSQKTLLSRGILGAQAVE
jgi:hypothetical protein